jgi:chromate reductase, NAD(P)H dehydrogenase (quinone)
MNWRNQNITAKDLLQVMRIKDQFIILEKNYLRRTNGQGVNWPSTSSLVPEIVEIGNLPLYDQDLDDEGQPPTAWTGFRNRLQSFDGVLFVTPEYNRSIPGPLKNTLDVGSCPY